jgi:hypothetical protein
MMLPDVSSPARLAHQPRRGTPRASNRQHDEHGDIAGAALTGTALTGTVHMPTDAIAVSPLAAWVAGTAVRWWWASP